MTDLTEYMKVQMHLPTGTFDKTIEALRANGCRVDDLCGVSRTGRVVDVWIPKDQLEEARMEEHVGYFMGESPEEKT